MPKFSPISSARLSSCHLDLQKLFNAMIQSRDCTILCGFRNQEDQDMAFAKGFSKLKWPNGKHNKLPSMAVDASPYPVDWNDFPRFREFAEQVKEKAKELGIEIIYGGDWADFPDVDHFELKEKSNG